MTKARRLKKEMKHWTRLTQEWYELAQLRGAALQRVWLVLETMPDVGVAQLIRQAIVGDMLFEIGVDDESIGAVLPEMPYGTEADPE